MSLQGLSILNRVDQFSQFNVVCTQSPAPRSIYDDMKENRPYIGATQNPTGGWSPSAPGQHMHGLQVLEILTQPLS